MSSGSTGNPGSVQGQQFLGTGSYRTWNGDDGRYEVSSSGKVRSHWNSYSLERGTRVRTSNKWTCTKASNGSTFTVLADVAGTIPTNPAGMSNSVQVQAQSRLADQVRGHSFNLAVNAAQSRQLVGMVVDNLGKFGRSVLALKRGDFSTAARCLGARPRPTRLKTSDIAGRWLELQYGWLPAVSDTYEAAKAYEVITKQERSATVRSSASARYTVEHAVGGFATAVANVTYRVGYTYEMSEVLNTPRLLGLKDPLSVAWELLPYSFVVDWFVPIGAYLDNLSILPFLRGRYIVSKVKVVDGHAPLTFTNPLPGFFGGFLCSNVQYNGTDTLRLIRVDRQASTGAPTTAFPSFDKTGLHGRRVWNAIALASQRFLS